VAASLKVLELISSSGELRKRLHDNTAFFRDLMMSEGFNLVPGEHPIVPIMLGDAALASKMADALLDRGVYVVAFSYPVVPQGKARIRVQMSATHTREELAFAVKQFADVRAF
jgi:glycine C-acetyltransferase